MNKKLTQIEQIEDHLLIHGKITSWGAITKYSITRLSEYIRILRHVKHWTISSTWKHNSERRWVLYQLKNYPNS